MRKQGCLLGLLFAIFAPNAMPAPRESAVTYDLIIRHGTLYDGSGQAPVIGDVAINGDTIAAVGQLERARGRKEIDARGLAVAPGFINMLSWATESLLHDGRSQSDIRQGVTLEVMGEGDSMGPLNAAMKKDMLDQQGDIKFPIKWTTLGQYLDHLVKRGVSCNVASFIGATTPRVHEIGYADRPPTPAELARMKALVHQAMEEGALGIASSLIYAPAFYAKTDELIALAKVASEHGGIYISHLRSEGNRFLEALDELLTIAREANIPAQIYHLKAAGRSNWNKLDAAIAKIEAARRGAIRDNGRDKVAAVFQPVVEPGIQPDGRDRMCGGEDDEDESSDRLHATIVKIAAARAAGLKITADMYTYTAGATGLDAAMPPWVQEGGYSEWARRLKDPATRARVAREMTTPTDTWENFFVAAGSPINILLVQFKNPKLKPLTGKTLAEVAWLRGKSPEETAMDLVVEDGSRVGTVYFLMSEENVRQQIKLPWVSFDSDAASLAPEGAFLKSNPHPRAYGNFARLLGKYVRDEKLIPLEEAIRRLTLFPAETLKIQKRGALRPGYFADVAVFDPTKIQDHATFDRPHQYSTGVIHVFVNGVQVLKHGEHTGAKPGRVVRGPGWKQK